MVGRASRPLLIFPLPLLTFPLLSLFLPRLQAIGLQLFVQVGAVQTDLLGQEADVAPAFRQFAPQELLFEQGPGLTEGRHLQEGVDVQVRRRPPAGGGLGQGRSRVLGRGGQGQVGHVNDGAGAEDGQAEDEIFQFPDVPRPGHRRQGLQGRG